MAIYYWHGGGDGHLQDPANYLLDDQSTPSSVVPGGGDVVRYIPEWSFPPFAGFSEADWVLVGHESFPSYPLAGTAEFFGTITEELPNPAEDALVAEFYGGVYRGEIDLSVIRLESGIIEFHSAVGHKIVLLDPSAVVVFHSTSRVRFNDESGSSVLYGPMNEAVASPSDVRDGVTNLGINGTMLVPKVDITRPINL